MLNMNRKVTCPQCKGFGHRTIWEDNILVNDACYHCGNSGRITVFVLLLDFVRGACNATAAQIVDEFKEFANGPEGDGWALHAGEAGVSESEYTLSQQVQQSDIIYRAIHAALAANRHSRVFQSDLSVEALEAFVLLACPEARVALGIGKSPAKGGSEMEKIQTHNCTEAEARTLMDVDPREVYKDAYQRFDNRVDGKVVPEVVDEASLPF